MFSQSAFNLNWCQINHYGQNTIYNLYSIGYNEIHCQMNHIFSQIFSIYIIN